MNIWPYKTVGKSTNLPLVFLHGFMGSSRDWLPIAGPLADRFFCLLPDLPGHGENRNLPVLQPLNFEIVTNQFKQWLDELGLKRITLVGYSLGGRIALYAAVQFPERIEKLVLESANPGLVETEARQTRTTVDDERAETLLRVGLETFVEQWYELELFQTLKQQPQLLAQLKAERKRNDARWLAKIISELSPGRQPPLWGHLDSLSIPVLLMAGALDTKYVDLVKKMSRLMPQVNIEICPQAGHNIHLEQPELFLEKLLLWLPKQENKRARK